MKSEKSIAARILYVTLLSVITLATILVLVMTYFMNSLADTILLNMLQPMAKAAAQDVEANLHTLEDRFFLIRDNAVFTSKDATKEDMQVFLEKTKSGIEFVWLGIYEPDGSLLAGSDECPRSISGTKLSSMVKQTTNLVIEDTSIGNSGLEIVMGAPVTDTRLSENGKDYEPYITYILVGSYKYDVISDVLSNINIGANGTAFIMNEEGRLIAHKDLGKVFGRENIEMNLGTDDEVKNVLSLMKQGQTGSNQIHNSKTEIFISFAPIRGTRWSLGIEVHRGDFLSAVQQAVFICVIITAVALILFAAILIYFIKKVLTVPLNAITGNARNLALGRFESSLPKKLTERNDEIGQLSSAFLSMSDTIHSVIHDIGRLTIAARSGLLNERAALSGHEGDYHLIISGINSTLDVFCAHLDFMPGAVAIFDGSMKPVYHNCSMDEIWESHGIDVENENLLASIVSSGVSDILSDEVAILFSPEYKSDETYEAGVTFTGAGGDKHDYSLSMRRTGGSGGLNICVMLVLRDVTMLTRAKTDAEMASNAKSDFLANMSHEMRTPMNAIIGMTNIAKSTESIERKNYCLAKIDEASIHLLGVINDILDMSKIEANKFELSYTEFSFEKMLQKVVNVNNFRVSEKQLDLSVRLDQNIPSRLISDDQRISQVITNLLSNAVKFTPENGVIKLDTHLVEEKDGVCTIQIEVNDTGIGISEEQQARLFTSFEQADSSISRKFGGTGLGLAISKRIVEMLGGRIWVESEMGSGSKFAFTINAERGSKGEYHLLGKDVNWSNVRLLAVDDAPEIREYFTELAKQLGVNCDVASGGEEALELINQNGSYDIFFVDWRMPGMNGIELSRRIKEQYDKKSVVIMISATEWDAIESDAKSAGVDKFLPKPLFPSSISDCISECLGNNCVIDTDEAQKEEMDNFEGHRILLAEDVEINREIVMALLEPTRLEIVYAENGAEALRLFSADPDSYDMIFMDVQMPEMDGYEATRRIRTLEAHLERKVPIVAMTANVFREDIEKCLASGMNDHIGKPIDIEEVLSKLRKYL